MNKSLDVIEALKFGPVMLDTRGTAVAESNFTQIMGPL